MSMFDGVDPIDDRRLGTWYGVEHHLRAVPGVVLSRVLEAYRVNGEAYYATIQIVVDDGIDMVKVHEALMEIEEAKPAHLVFDHEVIEANDGHRTIAANRWLLGAWDDVEWARRVE